MMTCDSSGIPQAKGDGTNQENTTMTILSKDRARVVHSKAPKGKLEKQQQLEEEAHFFRLSFSVMMVRL